MALLVGSAYFYAAPGDVAYDWRLNGGRPFSATELNRALAALQDAGIPSVETGGLLGVPADRFAEASSILEKAGVGQRSLDVLRREAVEAPSFFDSPELRAAKELHNKEAQLETLILRVSGVSAAAVILTPFDATSGLRRAAKIQGIRGRPIRGRRPALGGGR